MKMTTKIKKTLKMKTTLKVKTIPKMKMTSKMITTPTGFFVTTCSDHGEITEKSQRNHGEIMVTITNLVENHDHVTIFNLW